jgi:hypothetical protein
MLAAVVAMAALAGGVGGGDISDRPLDWALAGVGAGGRTLVVQPGVYGGCDRGTPRVSVRERRSRIVVTVTVRSVQGPEVVCPAIARYAPARSVRLARPVSGRPISGDLQADAPGFVLESRTPTSARPRVPRVVGLASSDARLVLCAWRIRAVTVGPTHRGRVVGQRPRPGAAYRVPAGAAPKDCDRLPDGPVARLTIR